MKKHQSGISLIAVLVIMGVLGAAAVFALISMRQNRNLFAEGVDKVRAKAVAVAAPVVSQVAPPAPMRKCVINGKTVISNTECGDKGSVIDIHDTRGFEAPKAPPKQEPEAAPPASTERAIERATR